MYYYLIIAPIVYRPGHLVLIQESGVRLSVGAPAKGFNIHTLMYFDKETAMDQLVCDQTNRPIIFGTPLFAGTRKDNIHYFPLSARALVKIPDSVKRSMRCNPRDGGIDIYDAKSTKDPNNNFYTISGFTLGSFRYSLSHQAAVKYLPHHILRYPPEPDIIINLAKA
jgi:hypothetical protein